MCYKTDNACVNLFVFLYQLYHELLYMYIVKYLFFCITYTMKCYKCTIFIFCITHTMNCYTLQYLLFCISYTMRCYTIHVQYLFFCITYTMSCYTWIIFVFLHHLYHELLYMYNVYWSLTCQLNILWKFFTRIWRSQPYTKRATWATQEGYLCMFTWVPMHKTYIFYNRYDCFT